jgi:hypothetical protein
MKKIVTVLKWTAVILAAAFSLLVIVRIPHVFEVQKTGDLVAKIHATKLTLDDVMGKNLPPDPGAEADKTVAGIDANRNGIRDDVELAIFKEYSNSAKTRAALLQYALVLQMEATQPFVNSELVGEVANGEDRAFFCVAKLIPGGGEGAAYTAMETYRKFLFDMQFNSDARKKANKDFYSNLKSGRIDDSVSCDIDPTSLPN